MNTKKHQSNRSSRREENPSAENVRHNAIEHASPVAKVSRCGAGLRPAGCGLSEGAARGNALEPLSVQGTRGSRNRRVGDPPHVRQSVRWQALAVFGIRVSKLRMDQSLLTSAVTVKGFKARSSFSAKFLPHGGEGASPSVGGIPSVFTPAQTTSFVTLK